jgi:hypothetical protein
VDTFIGGLSPLLRLPLQIHIPDSARRMSASVTRSITDSVNSSLRKINANVDNIKIVAIDAKQVAEMVARTASTNTQAITGVEQALSKAMEQIAALEARIAAIENKPAA